MNKDRFSAVIPNLNKPNLDVYHWLSSWTTEEPLMNQWLPTSHEKNHIEELNGNETRYIPNIWVWVIGCLAASLLCMFLVVVMFAKIYKWETHHGYCYSFSDLRKHGIFRANKSNEILNGDDPYERPIRDTELKEIHVYQKGRRVGTDDHTLLLDDVSFDNIDSHRTSPCLNPEDTINQTQRPKRIGSPFWIKCSPKLEQENRNQEDNFTERSKFLKEFQSRPLPPLPATSDHSLCKSSSPFQAEHIFNYSFDDYPKTSLLGEITAIFDFEKLEKHISTNSLQESMYLVDYTSKRLNTFSEFRKHKSTITRSKQTRNTSLLKRNRSNSMEDRTLSGNKTSEPKKTEQGFRRSYSLDDIVENNINGYLDIRSCEELEDDQFQDTCDSYLTDSTFTSPREGGIASFSSLCTSNDNINENMYAKIPELPLHKDKIENIQRRQLPPVPTLLDTCFMNQNPATMGKNHIYQRASILNINSLLKNNQDKDEESEYLTEQLHSFRSTYSNASGHYAKIPEENGMKRVSNLYTQIFENHS